MTGSELVALLRETATPFHLIGSVTDGVVAALANEGRLFAMARGEVTRRADADALVRRNPKSAYAPAGGDACIPRRGLHYAVRCVRPRFPLGRHSSCGQRSTECRPSATWTPRPSMYSGQALRLPFDSLRSLKVAQDHSTRHQMAFDGIAMACHGQGRVVAKTTGPR